MSVTCTLLAVLMTARLAGAQTSHPVEVSAGYSFLRDTTQDVNFPAGWNVGLAVAVTSWLSVAADGGGHYTTVPVFDADVTLRTHTVAAGLRASAHVGPFIEFGQLLAGISHGSGSAFGSSDSVTHFMWQPGVGLDLPVGSRFSVRAELDGRFLSPINEFRFAAGVVCRLPHR